MAMSQAKRFIRSFIYGASFSILILLCMGLSWRWRADSLIEEVDQSVAFKERPEVNVGLEREAVLALLGAPSCVFNSTETDVCRPYSEDTNRGRIYVYIYFQFRTMVLFRIDGKVEKHWVDYYWVD
jgi:hypothetical protein